MRPTVLLPNCFVAMFLGMVAIQSRAAEAVSFAKEIAPVLAAKCVTCHGPEKAKGGYRLDTFAALLKPGESEKKPVVASQAEQSPLQSSRRTN